MKNMVWQKIDTLDVALIIISMTVILSMSFCSKLFWMRSSQPTNKHSRKKQKKWQNNQNTVLQYLLMGRQLTMPLFVMTLVSTWYGGIFGVTQIAFEHGVYNFITQGFFWYLAYIVFALCFAKKIHEMKVYSLSEMIGQLFGAKSAKLTAVLLFIKTLPISYAIGLGLFLQTMFDIPLMNGIFISCGTVAIFGCFGGIRGVVLRDVVQFTLMYVAVISVVVCSIWKFGGLGFLKTNLPDSYFSLNGQHDYKITILWLFIAFSSTLVSPVFYQRCLAAKNGKVARTGILISTCFWFIFDICTTLGGMYAKAIMPEAESTNGYLLYGLEILPSGFRGIFIAGIVATVLSTLDAFTFSSSTLLSYDLFRIHFRNPRIETIIRTIATILTSAITAGLAISFNGRIEDAWLMLELYAGATIMMPIIWKRFFIKTIIRDWQYVSCCLLSIIIIAATRSFINISSFYLASIAVISSLGVFSNQNSYHNDQGQKS